MADQWKQLKEQAIEIEKLKAEQALTTESHGCEDRGHPRNWNMIHTI